MHLGLSGKSTLCLVTVALALAVLLVGVLDADLLVQEVLAVHVADGVVGGVEVGEGDETVALGQVGLVASNLSKLERFLGAMDRTHTFGAVTNVPNLEKTSYKTFSSTMGSKLPTNSSAPTSIVFCLSALALLTRMGFP